MTKKSQKSKRKFILKIIASFFFLLIIILGIYGYRLYQGIYKPNVNLKGKNQTIIYIPTGSNYQDVKKILFSEGIIINTNTFDWLAEKKDYVQHVKPGRYLIKASFSNNDIINMLRAGQQLPVKLKFNNIRTKNQLAGKIAAQIEADSAEMEQLLNDEETAQKYNFNKENFLTMFLPNTYEFIWNTSAAQFIERMNKEYKKFWNNDRIAKAKNLGLSPIEISILASIVDKETQKTSEMSRIAGVYLNRIKRNMPLQADPTVVYAVGDFSIRRVLKRHLEIESPYNTYKNTGLPPGPICVPAVTTIDKTLNAERHHYLYFCAREDFSGFHNFAENLAQHNNNAQKYQKSLDKRKIR